MALILDNASRPTTFIDRRPADTNTHTVGFGDSVHGVSRQHGVDPQALLATNPQLRDTTTPLIFGDVLDIPQDADSQLETHTLESGETVADVSQSQGVDLQALLDLNGIANPDGVYPGATLLLPRSAPGDSDAVDAPSAETLAAQAQTETIQQAADIHADALAAVGVPVEDWTAAEAAQYTGYLVQAVEDHPGDTALADALIVASEIELQRSAELLGNATENKDGAEEDVKALTDNVSVLGNAASDEIGTVLAYAVADQIPEDSEQNWVDDGFGEYVDRTGNARFLEMLGATLHAQGKGEAGDEMLHTSAGGVFGHGGAFDDTVGAIAAFPGNVWEFAREKLLNPVGDRLREAISDVLDIEGRLARLDSPGDSITLNLDVEGTLLGVEVGVGGIIRVERTGDGYAIELTGQGSLGVAAEFGLPGIPSASAEATGEVSATVRFEFDSLEDATRAAEIIAATGVGVGLLPTGPGAIVGGVLLASQADDFSFVAGGYAQTTLQFESQASISADVAEDLGLPGADFSGTVSNAVSIMLPNTDKDDGASPQLVLEQSMTVDGALDLAGPFTLEDGSVVNPANVSGSGGLSLRTTVPIDVSADELIADPIGELRDAGSTVLEGAETTLTGTFNFEEGVSISGGGVEVNGNEGVQVQISASVPTAELGGAITRAFSGDLFGAIASLGENATMSGSVSVYEDTEVGIGDVSEQNDGETNTDPEGVVVGVPSVASIEVTAGYAEHGSEVVVEFDGSPGELLSEFGGFVENISYVAG